MINISPEGKLRLKPDLLVHLKGNVLVLTSMVHRTVKEFDVEPWVAKLIPQFDGRLSLPELAESNGLANEQVYSIASVLVSEGLVSTLPPVEVSSERYASQISFLDCLANEMDGGASAEELHAKLRAARVLVIGVGGAGSNVLQALAQMGIDNFSIVDPDVVESGNLNRQVLFRDSDIGSYKVEAAARALCLLNPQAEVLSLASSIGGCDDLRPLLKNVDLVISCADYPSVARVSSWVSRVCHEFGVPHIVGGAYGANFGIPGYSVLPGVTPCWSCATAAASEQIHSMSGALMPRRSTGSLAPIVALVAGVTVWDAARIIVGATPLLAGKLRELDIFTLSWHDSEVSIQPGCQNCVG